MKIILIIVSIVLVLCNDIKNEYYEYGTIINVESGGHYKNMCTIQLSNGDRTSFRSNRLIIGDSVSIKNSIYGYKILNLIEKKEN